MRRRSKSVVTTPPTTEATEEPAGAPPCLICQKPATWTSPTGHQFCENCRNLYTDLFPPDGLQPVDLRALMSGERPDEDWMVAPLLPAGKLVGIISRRGEGKSILLLDVAACLACGLATLLQPASDPIPVIYIDMEMGPDDLYERLADLGYTVDHPQFPLLCQNLYYYQLVALPPLDTEEGGKALEELVDRHGAKLVVIDTVSRVVSGSENDADPFRELFRHTETRLKRRRVTLARLDHLGKDKERGSRGSSAKEDPLDVVWHLTISITGTVELTLTKGRQSWIPRNISVHRMDYAGITRHIIPEETAEEWLLELVSWMDRLQIPLDTSINQTAQILKKASRGAHKSKVSQAVTFRRRRTSKWFSNPRTTPLDGSGTISRTTQNHLSETLISIDESPEPPSRTTQNRVVLDMAPPKGGLSQNRVELEDDLDDYDPDPADLPEEQDDDDA